MDEFRTVIELISQLPPLAQILLILLFTGGPAGIVGTVMAILQSRNNASINRTLLDTKAQLARTEAQTAKIKAEAQARLEAVESQQIRAQAEADQVRAINANMERLILGMVEGNKLTAKTNEQWQLVVSTQSERRHEDIDHLGTVMDKVMGALDRNSIAVGNLTEMLEIQSEQLGTLDTTVTAVGAAMQATMTQMEGMARDNRTDLTTALGLSVSNQTKTDQTLVTIIEAINNIARTVTQTVTQNESQRNQTLTAINNQLKSIETNIASLIAPRPALLGTSPAGPAATLKPKVVQDAESDKEQI